MENRRIKKPSSKEVEKYLKIWDNTDSTFLQENALNKLFLETYRYNVDINDILIKVASLNDFYSTNVYYVFDLAKHIHDLEIDSKLIEGDIGLVNEIAKVQVSTGKTINYYSFATKYCSHHRPLKYPVYDNYVDKILKYFIKIDGFYSGSLNFREYKNFYKAVNNFKGFYNLKYSVKEIDKYLWLLGKQSFPKKY